MKPTGSMSVLLWLQKHYLFLTCNPITYITDIAFFPCRPEKNAYDGIILEIIYTIFKEKHSLKAGIQYMTFAQIFASIYSLDESKLVTKNQNQSADFGQLELTDLAENHILYDEHGFQIIIFSSRPWICVVKGHQTCLSRF